MIYIYIFKFTESEMPEKRPKTVRVESKTEAHPGGGFFVGRCGAAKRVF